MTVIEERLYINNLREKYWHIQDDYNNFLSYKTIYRSYNTSARNVVYVCSEYPSSLQYRLLGKSIPPKYGHLLQGSHFIRDAVWRDIFCHICYNLKQSRVKDQIYPSKTRPLHKGCCLEWVFGLFTVICFKIKLKIPPKSIPYEMAALEQMSIFWRDVISMESYIVVVVSKRSMSKIVFFHFLIVSWST